MSTGTPIARAAGEGERRWFHGGGTHTWKLKEGDTGGAFFLFEDAMVQGKMTPLHAHPDSDETVIVLEGEILVHTDGVEHVVAAGGINYTPRGVPHAFSVLSATARLLTFQTPGSAQAFYWNASEPATAEGDGPVDFDEVGRVAQETGATKLMGPPPFAMAVTP